MRRLPGYEFEELLHDSGMSVVYRARRKLDGAAVTVKEAQSSVVSARQFTRYRNEYELLGALDIEGVSKAYDLIRHEGRLALVLEHLDGVPLREWRDRSRFDLPQLLDIAIQIAVTLGRVHAAGVIHKDVNSQNIIYDAATRQARLVDFGIATRLRTESSQFQYPAALEGTLAYMAPEQTGRMNRHVDHRADWYSFGVTLYELFSGVLPHDSDDPLDFVHFHMARQPVPLADLDAGIPVAVSGIVMKLLCKAPEDRYQSAAGVIADLERCRDNLLSEEPLEAFELGSADNVDRFEPPQKLYGREAETDLLLETFERVAAGTAEAVLIAGPAGIGKTSLVNEIHRPVTHKRGYFAAGKFDQFRRETPFSALVEALQSLIEQLLTESVESIDAWRDAIRKAVGSNAQLLVSVIPPLEHIIGPQPPVPSLPSFEAVNRFQLVFQSFVQVFAKREHPLVLFLDDMQWADSASLNLVSVLLGSTATDSLLIVEAYRDEEVSGGHPFMLAVKAQRDRGVHVADISLAPLGVPDVVAFLAETLHRDGESVAPLATVIHEKTAGNPFFMREFLRSLYEEGLLEFDPGSRGFRYDIDTIRSSPITENVAGILSAKLDKLDAATQRALRLAAAIGGRFDLATLALISGTAEAQVADQLRPALVDGVVMPASRLEPLDPGELDSPLVYRQFAFLHDRVQQAAYEMVPAGERPALHLEIGRLLLADANDATLERRLFDVVNHMNQGAELIGDASERLRLVELNLRAGRKARDSTAYSAAVRSFRTAVELLGGAGAWDSNYDLAADAYGQLAESLCLSASYDEAFETLDAALERTVSLTDRVGLMALKVNTHLSLGQLAEALSCGRRGAGMLGVDLPTDAAQIESVLSAEIEAILARTDEIGVENLLELPTMHDGEKTALISLLTHCLPAAFQTDQQLFALICCKMVSLSLEHGNCPLSARAYGSFGALLSGALGRYRDAYRFTKLGVDLAHRLDDVSVYSGVYFLLAHFASHWNEPVENSIELFQKGIQYGLETGDHPHVTYNAARRVSHLLFSGMPLAELREEAEAALEISERIGERTNVPFIRPHLWLIDWLRGERPRGDTLGDDDWSEDAWTGATHALGNHSFESDWFTMLLMHRYLCGDYSAAYRFSLQARELLPFSAGFLTRPQHNFFSSMTAAALYDSADAAAQAEYDELLASNQADLEAWARLCPDNFGAMHALVEAERVRLGGATAEAMRLYDHAIAAAARRGFAHVEAIAAERAAAFWYGQDKADFGGMYLDKALHSYEIWGAAGKAADLAGAHGRGTRRLSARTESATTMAQSTSHGDALDLATVLKASQAIASELELEPLLAKLMDMIVENAGAESAVLILESDGRFMVQGVKDSPSAAARTMLAEPLADSAAVSTGIVNYVIRTSEPVVLEKPASRGKFSADDYVRRHEPRSVLCAPILHKGRLTGVVYLENNQLAGVFTPGRLEALTVLMSQIAISLENAALYTQQQQQARSIELANEALRKEVLERRHAEQELSRYKDHLEELVAKRTRELESTQGRLVDLSRRAGMAEVASGVLHNVGNVMNSVNVGTNVVRDSVRELRVDRLEKVCELLDRHADNLGEYFASDPAGSKLPEYLKLLARQLAEDKAGMRREVDRVLEHIEHMKRIISAQQSYAKVNGVNEVCTLEEIAETAIAISEAALRNARVRVIREFDAVPAAMLDRHQIMQILVNLISNARHALADHDPEDRRLTIAIRAESEGASVEVADNGSGISRDNLTRVFNHGFTTKKDGHGFGLHNCANAAQQMGGSLDVFSDGPGSGARFVLQIPMDPPAAAHSKAGAA